MAELLLFLVFIAGVIMELFQIPFHTVVMVAALISIIALNLSRLLKNKPGVKRTAGWLGIATVSWLIFFLFEVKFFGGTLILMASALFVSVLSLLMTLFEPGQLPGGRILVLLAALALSATTSWMSPHKRFYTYNIRFNNDALTDYHTLDQYSWFLYLGQEYDQALQISQLASTVADKKGDENYAHQIGLHAQAIKNRSWTEY